LGGAQYPRCLKATGARSAKSARASWAWFLLALAGSYNAQADSWTTALVERDAEAIARLLPEVTDVNATAPDGRTALMVAAGAAEPKLVQVLLARGADANARNRRGGSALMYAATAGDRESVQALLARGARINATAQNGWTALMLATARGFDPIVRLLLEQGADPEIADIYGTTPLIRAVQQERRSAARLLLEIGRARTEVRDESGGTALHHAAGQGEVELVRILIAHGANRAARNRAGQTPLDLATIAGHPAVVELLRRAAESSPLSTESDSGSTR